jgi:hypothetical protein
MRLLRSVRAGIAVACVSTLAAATLVPAASAASGAASKAAGAEAPLQSISIKVAKKTITVRGAKGLDAGRIKVEVTGRGTAEILMFDRGYDYRDFAKDLAAFEKGSIKALKRALAHTEILGGVQPGGSGTVVLPKAGDYTVFSLRSSGHDDFTAGAVRKTRTPEVDGKIIGRTGPKFGGSSHLPAKGTFLLKNADPTVPHMVEIQQVAEGTTTDQVLEALTSEEQGPPPEWVLPARMDAGSVSPGRSMTVDYKLPPGQYAVMCFFPDPNMKGMPHAFMGMIKMVTVG